MTDCMQLALTFITTIVQSITPDNPLFFVVGLGLLASIFGLLLNFTRIKN